MGVASGATSQLLDIILSSRLNQDCQNVEIYKMGEDESYDSEPSCSFPTTMCHITLEERGEAYETYPLVRI